MKEVEILVKVLGSKKETIKALDKLNYKGTEQTRDLYFFDPRREDLKPDPSGRLSSAFRVREKGKKAFLAYKVDHFDGDTWLYSDEHEVNISHVEGVLKIIENLGLKKLVEIDNKKRIYTSGNYEIVFEDVKDLGLFLEVELLNIHDNADVAEEKKKIRQFINKLGVKIGSELNAGKPELMLKKVKDV